MPAGDPRQENLRELEDIPEFYRLEIHHFFTVYKELEPGKGVRDTAWAGRLAAEAEVEEAVAARSDRDRPAAAKLTAFARRLPSAEFGRGSRRRSRTSVPATRSDRLRHAALADAVAAAGPGPRRAGLRSADRGSAG